ncbi:ABC transporter substrate-binding protein [Methylosinus sp.]|uniref:ABC transporter substrate-binding protein n=1 Tax=Methylosinus sp. TaxID=427 RepID=UPI002F92C3A9
MTKTAILGGVPVVNSYVFLAGDRDTIITGLPAFATTPRWRFQTRLAPRLAKLPTMQDPAGRANIEALLGARPDVVLVSGAAAEESAEQLERLGLTPFRLTRFGADGDRDAVDRRIIAAVGKLYGRERAADAYDRLFDETHARLRRGLTGLSDAERPKVLYFEYGLMRQQHYVPDWWIAHAGGVSVTARDRHTELMALSVEQVIAWDPDIIIVNSRREIDEVRKDRRLADLTAVRANRIHAIPWGVCGWGYHTVEHPLTLLWAAKLLHPDRFRDIDLAGELKRFYSGFFSYTLDDEEAADILAGAPDR